MFYGLGHGFVIFGTVQHRILRLLLEHGRLTHQDFVDEGAGSANAVSVTLKRLRELRFIFRVDKAHKYDTGRTTAAIYSLKRCNFPPRYKPATMRERGRRYDRRQAQARRRAASVFDFRP